MIIALIITVIKFFHTHSFKFRFKKVLFVDEKSRSFVKENNNCDFYISSDESSSGILENPKHSLPPNTTCRYHFQGKPNEIVWLSFVKYYAASADAAASIDVASDCNAKLFIWDGDRTLDKLIPIRKVRDMPCPRPSFSTIIFKTDCNLKEKHLFF